MSLPNPYQTPETSADVYSIGGQEQGIDYMRVVAGILATGGVLWGVLFGLVIVFGYNQLFALMIALPGYAVTFGYLVRTFRSPAIATKRWIWGSSAVVQGAWLAFLVLNCRGSDYLTPLVLILLAWWGGTTLASIIGFFVDGWPRANEIHWQER